MNITENEDYYFVKYVANINTTEKDNPFEKNYQEVIKNVMNEILINTEIKAIDSSKNKTTEVHNAEKYVGVSGPPDLLLVPEKYQYKNKDNEEKNPQPIVAIEVKTPKGRMNISEFVAKLKNDQVQQLKSHLSKNKKVIVTDCIKWCFFENNNVDKKDGFKLVESFNLKDGFGEWKVEKTKTDEFVQELLDLEESYLGTECKEWNDLQDFIREWVFKE